MHVHILSALVTLSTMVVLCLPPLIALRVLRRRLRTARFDHRRLYRWALVGTVFALMFNLAVAVLAPPNFDAGLKGNNLEALHIVALFFSWMCFWGCVALLTLFRHRRPSSLDPI